MNILKKRMNVLKAGLLIATLAVSACVPGNRSKDASETEKTPVGATATDSLHYDAVTGLVADENMAVVVANCSACHSTELIRQNRFTRDGWLAKIRWMQREQNLWDLGEYEPAILDYLEKYYSPSAADGRAHWRRKPLGDIQWYNY